MTLLTTLGEKWTEPRTAVLVRRHRTIGRTSVQVGSEPASLIKLFWEAPSGVEHRSRGETSGAHLGRKAEGMVKASTIGVISSQAPKDESPRGRFRDRTVGR